VSLSMREESQTGLFPDNPVSVCTARRVDGTPVALSPDGGHRSFGSRAITVGQR
jgi:hypothetical protein